MANMRYSQIIPIIKQIKPKTILEIGTHNGTRPAEWFEVHKDFHYYGFDLFEMANDTTLAKEGLLYKGGSIFARTAKRFDNMGLKYDIFKGYSQETLPTFIREYGRCIDFAYIDGGHDPNTIRIDWENVKQVMNPGGTVIFDDYYTHTNIDVNELGCNLVVDQIPNRMILKQSDRVNGRKGLVTIHLVKVQL